MIVIKLSTVEEIKEFVNIVTKFSSHIDVVSDRYVVNAKSIFGLLSLNLTKGFIVRVEDETEESAVTDALRKFM